MKPTQRLLTYLTLVVFSLLGHPTLLKAAGHWEITHLPYPEDAFLPAINNSNEIVWEYPGIISSVRGTLSSTGNYPRISNSGEVVYADWFGGPYWDLVSNTRGRLTQGNIIDLNASKFDVNSSGEFVYVTKDTNGVNQVYSNVRGQITFDLTTHYNPCINDLGEIIWTEDIDGLGMKAFSTTRGRLPGNYLLIHSLNNAGDFCYEENLLGTYPHLFSYFYGPVINGPENQWGGGMNDAGTVVWMGTNGLYAGNWVGMSPPIIQLNGPEPLTNECHTAFTDPGAIAFTFDAPPVPGQFNATNYLPLTVSGTVDANSPGLYPLTYTATNSEGVVTTITRTVVVADTTPPSFLACLADFTVDDTNIDGVPIVYAPPTTSDICSGNVSIGFAPPSGSWLTIGTNAITCFATDDSGNTAQCSFTVTVLGPQGIKKDVLASLTEVRSAMRTSQLRTYDLSVAALTHSLTQDFWLNETHFNTKTGKKVFQDDASTVHLLAVTIDRGNDKVINSLLQNWIERLANADRLVTEFEIEDAVIANMNQKQINKATTEVSKGDQAVAKHNYTSAILHYQSAWQLLNRQLPR